MHKVFNWNLVQRHLLLRAFHLKVTITEPKTDHRVVSSLVRTVMVAIAYHAFIAHEIVSLFNSVLSILGKKLQPTASHVTPREEPLARYRTT